MADKVKLRGVGCYVNMTCMSILLYADDILLVAPSVASLQRILSICEAELDWLDMRINPTKSSCIRFGARFGVECSNISTSNDSKLPWSDNFRYLGVYLRSSRSFPVPLVTQSTLCIVLSTQFSGKLGELHLRMS